ncbi:MAG TPA: hypothetical protein VIA45_04405 [Thermoanaerobaculia bacterium]
MHAKRTGTRLLGAVAVGLAIAVAAPAEVTENTKIPVEIDLEIPCANGGAGEEVLLTGNLHVLTTFVINKNVIQGHFHDQPEGVSGFGSVSGDHYKATGVSQGEFKSSLHNGEAIVSFINNFRIIGQGPGNNYIVHQNVHLIISANGDLTTVVDGVEADCK